MKIRSFPPVALAVLALAAAVTACSDSDTTTDSPDAVSEIPGDTLGGDLPDGDTGGESDSGGGTDPGGSTDTGSGTDTGGGSDPGSGTDTGGGSDPGIGTDTGGDVTPLSKARIRAIHLSPDAPAVDLFVNGGSTPAVTGLSFPNGTGYLEVDAGTYDFDIAPAGAGIGASVLSIDDLTLAGGQSYTAVAFDRVSSLKALALQDDYSGLAAGDIRVRAIHAAAGIGQVDIWALPEGGSPAPLITDLDFGSYSGYLDLPAAAYTIGFDVDDDANPDVVFDLPALPAGTVANVFAVLQGADVALIAQVNDGTTVRIDPRPAPGAKARLRVLHLSPDAPAVDILGSGGLRPIRSVPFLNSTVYLDVDPGTYDFDIVLSGPGNGTPVLSIQDLTLEGGRSYTAVAFDRLASLKALALEDDYALLAAGHIRVRAIHVAEGVGQVDLWNLPAGGEGPMNIRRLPAGSAPAPLVTNLDFGAASGYLDLPAAAYTIGIDVDDDANPDLVFDLPALPAGTVANVFAVRQYAQVFLVAQTNDGSVVQIDPRPGPAPKARLRAIHLAPATGAVDLFVDGGPSPAERDLRFSADTAYLELDEGTHTLQIALAGQGLQGAVLSLPDVALQGGRSYTLAIYGPEQGLRMILFEDLHDDIPPAFVRVRLMHAAAGVGLVDAFYFDRGSPRPRYAPLFLDLGYSVVTNGIDVPLPGFNLILDVDNDGIWDSTYGVVLPYDVFANLFILNIDGEARVYVLHPEGRVSVVYPDPPPQGT